MTEAVCDVYPYPYGNQELIPGGNFWFGSQLDIKGKILPAVPPDGATKRVKASVRSVVRWDPKPMSD